MRYEVNLLTGEVLELPDAEVLPVELTPEQIRQALVDEIESLERKQLMPRATREFMLTFMDLNAPAEVLAVNPGYQAVKAFDNQIKALRDQL